jgi:hypothetical protein
VILKTATVAPEIFRSFLVAINSTVERIKKDSVAIPPATSETNTKNSKILPVFGVPNETYGKKLPVCINDQRMYPAIIVTIADETTDCSCERLIPLSYTTI